MNQYPSPLGSLTLNRLPNTNSDNLQAWDAADTLLLQHCKEQNDINSSHSILVINDQFGALTSCLANYYQCKIDHWSDSYISYLATCDNLSSNNINTTVNFIESTQAPNKQYDYIFIKLPKTTALLETQLNGLGSQLANQGKLIAAGMCKHMPKSTYSIFEKHIGPTTTSLAIKKARLIFCSNNHIAKLSLNYPVEYYQPELGIHLSNHANVFSKEQLDIGARFFIQHFEHLQPKQSLIDLGCGNGVLGIMAKKMGLAEEIHFVDESYMALNSAKTNYLTAFGTLEGSHFHRSESLSQLQHVKANVILCNPPFHQQHQVGEQIAKRMFKQSKQLLNNDGELWVVANRHLSYYSYLKRLFKNCITIASNNKFNIYKAWQAN